MAAHLPAPYSEAILYAARALKDGKANEGQQKAFLQWLLFDACLISSLEYSPEGERASNVMSGRRLVGISVGRLFEPDALQGSVEALARAKRVVSSREKRKTRQEAQ